MRIRLAFNPSDAEHAAAVCHIEGQQKSNRTDYIVSCILEFERHRALEEVIAAAVKTEIERTLSSIKIINTSAPAEQPKGSLPTDFMEQLDTWT